MRIGQRMRKAHCHSPITMMRRTSRVYLNELNAGKAARVREFLHLCRDVVAYYVEMFWRAKDFSAELAPLATVHRACERFSITTRLSQALAKQAKEMVRSAHARGKRKPNVRRHAIALYCHFVRIEPFRGSFDWAVKLIGSGAPRMVIPVTSTAHLIGGRDHSRSCFRSFSLGSARRFSSRRVHASSPAIAPVIRTRTALAAGRDRIGRAGAVRASSPGVYPLTECEQCAEEAMPSTIASQS